MPKVYDAATGTLVDMSEEQLLAQAAAPSLDTGTSEPDFAAEHQALQEAAMRDRQVADQIRESEGVDEANPWLNSLKAAGYGLRGFNAAMARGAGELLFKAPRLVNPNLQGAEYEWLRGESADQLQRDLQRKKMAYDDPEVDFEAGMWQGRSDDKGFLEGLGRTTRGVIQESGPTVGMAVTALPFAAAASPAVVGASAPGAIAGGLTNLLTKLPAFMRPAAAAAPLAVGMRFSEGLGEGGMTAHEAQTRGRSENDIADAAVRTVLGNIPLAAVDIVQGAGFLAMMPKPAQRALGKVSRDYISKLPMGVLKRIAGLAAEMTSEGMEEAVQEEITSWALGEGFDPKVVYNPVYAKEKHPASFNIGALTALAQGGAHVTFDAVVKNGLDKMDPRQAVDIIKKGVLSGEEMAAARAAELNKAREKAAVSLDEGGGEGVGVVGLGDLEPITERNEEIELILDDFVGKNAEDLAVEAAQKIAAGELDAPEVIAYRARMGDVSGAKASVKTRHAAQKAAQQAKAERRAEAKKRALGIAGKAVEENEQVAQANRARKFQEELQSVIQAENEAAAQQEGTGLEDEPTPTIDGLLPENVDVDRMVNGATTKEDLFTLANALDRQGRLTPELINRMAIKNEALELAGPTEPGAVSSTQTKNAEDVGVQPGPEPVTGQVQEAAPQETVSEDQSPLHIDQVRDVFKWAEDVQPTKAGARVVHRGKSHEIEVVDYLNPADYEEAVEKHQVSGPTTMPAVFIPRSDGTFLIKVARGFDKSSRANKQSLTHESFHAAKELGLLTDGEIATVYQPYMRNVAKKMGFKNISAKALLTMDQDAEIDGVSVRAILDKVEEEVADDYGNWAPKHPRIINKIWNWLRKLSNTDVRELGSRKKAEGVYESLRSGQRRAPEQDSAHRTAPEEKEVGEAAPKTESDSRPPGERLKGMPDSEENVVTKGTARRAQAQIRTNKSVSADIESLAKKKLAEIDKIFDGAERIKAQIKKTHPGVEAAIWTPSKIYTGKFHFEALQEAIDEGALDPVLDGHGEKWIDGFLFPDGEFLNRDQTLKKIGISESEELAAARAKTEETSGAAEVTRAQLKTVRVTRQQWAAAEVKAKEDLQKLIDSASETNIPASTIQDLIRAGTMRHIGIPEKYLPKANRKEGVRIKYISEAEMTALRAELAKKKSELAKKVKSQIKTPEFKEFYKNASPLMKDENGDPILLFRGGFHDIEEIRLDKASPTGYLGAAFYTTTSPFDASVNYASRDSLDRVGQASRLEESIMYDIEAMRDEDMPYREIFKNLSEMYEFDLGEEDISLAEKYDKQIEGDEFSTLQDVGTSTWAANKVVYAEGGGRIYMLHMAAENPLVLHSTTRRKNEEGEEQTFWSVNFDEDGNIEGEFTDILDALWNTADSLGEDGGTSAEKVYQDVLSKLAEDYDLFDGEVTARQFFEAVYNSEAAYDVAVYNSEEDTDIGDFIRRVFDEAGYDAIIMDTDVFRTRGMDLVPGTKHYVTWKADIVKSFSAKTPKRGSNKISAQVKAPAHIRGVAAFKSWFGDSKVVDDQDNPIELYHGSVRRFDSFSRDETMVAAVGKGFYFTSNAEIANAYADPMRVFTEDPDPNVVPAYLSIKNPFYWDKTYKAGTEEHDAFMDALRYEIRAGAAAKYPGFKASDVVVFRSGVNGKRILDSMPREMIRDVLEVAGFDGIHMKSGRAGGPMMPFEEAPSGTTWVAFQPHQVKSIFNNGQWSMSERFAAQVRQEAFAQAKPLMGNSPPPWMDEKEFARATKLNDPRLNQWFGAKELAIHRIEVQGRILQKKLAKIVGRKNWLGHYKYGQETRDIAKAIHIYIDLKNEPEAYAKYYDKLTPYQKELTDMALTEVGGNPELVEFANKLKDLYEEAGKVAKQAGLIYNMRENYVNRVWRFNNKSASEADRSFGTTTRHRRRRKLPTILQGWAEGLEMSTEDAVENLVVYQKEIAKTLEDRNLIAYARKLKISDDPDAPFLFTHFRPEGHNYKELKHPNFKVWVYDSVERIGEVFKNPGGSSYKMKGSKLSFRKFAVYNPGGKVARRVFDSWDEAVNWIDVMGNKEMEIHERWENLRQEKLYAPPEIADHLNKITDEGFKNPKFKAALKFNAVVKSVILMTSFFHHMAFMRSFYLGTPGLTAFDADGKKFSKFRMIKAYKEGVRMIEEAAPDVEFLIQNSLTLGRLQDWEDFSLNDSKRFRKWFDKKGKTSRKIGNFLEELRQRQTSFLFKNFGAGLKIQAALIEFYHNREKYRGELSDEQIAQLSARLINEDFGGLNFDRMGVSKKTRELLRFFLLAPDWTGSNFLTLKRFAYSVLSKKHSEEHVREIYKKFWTGVVMKGIMATMLGNLMMSMLAPIAGDEEDPIKRLRHAWDEDWKRLQWTGVDITPVYKLVQRATGGQDDGRRRYFSLIGHFKDPIRWMIDPGRSLIHKGSPISRVFLEAIEGQDWKGDGFTNFEELLGIDEAGYYKSDGPGRKAGDPKGGQLRGKLTSRTKDSGFIQYDQIPSYLLSQMKGSTPVQVQEFIAVMEGQRTWFDGINRMAGMHMAPSRGTQFDLLSNKLREEENELNALRLSDRDKYVEKRKEISDKMGAIRALETYEKRIRKYKQKLVSIEKNKTLSDDRKREQKRFYEEKIMETENKFVEKFGKVT